MILRGETFYVERSPGIHTHPPGSIECAEEELARLLKAGSVAAWEMLFERNFDRVFRYALGRLMTPEAAEDVAAATFHRALSMIESYSYRGRPILAWLYGIARNVINETRRYEVRQRATGLIDTLLHRQNGHESSETLPLLQADCTQELVSQLDIHNAMRRLTAMQREVVLLRYFAGLTAAETGQAIGRPETAVYALQARALAALRRQLA
jgi:RNA polymerase sigma-70 factor (ECF subfamily)